MKLGISLAIVMIATACASPASTTTIVVSTPTLAILSPASTLTIVQALPTPLHDKVDVGGYALEIRCIGQGTPTVIIEAGLGDAPVRIGDWTSVTSKIKETARICIYDRAGLGLSDDAPGQTRTSKDIAQDLHTLLVNANVPKPYILVGHSIGGYHVRLFASQYSDEVVGMVLVDSSHPDQWSEIPAALPPESPDDPASLKELRIVPPVSPPEKLDILTSAAQVRATDPLGDLPLVVLTRSPTAHIYPDLSPEIAEKIEQLWQNLQNDLAGLSSNSTHVIAIRAGHFIHVDEPQLVIDAIFKVIDEAKKRGQ